MSYFLLHTNIFEQMNLSNKAFKGISEIKSLLEALNRLTLLHHFKLIRVSYLPKLTIESFNINYCVVL